MWPCGNRIPAPPLIPAFANITSSRPLRVTTSSTVRRMASGSATSTVAISAPGMISSPIRLSSFSFLSTRIKSAPLAAMVREMARPSPLAAPVTMVTRPLTAKRRSAVSDMRGSSFRHGRPLRLRPSRVVTPPRDKRRSWPRLSQSRQSMHKITLALSRRGGRDAGRRAQEHQQFRGGRAVHDNRGNECCGVHPRRRGLDVRTIPLMPFAEDSHPAPAEEDNVRG